MARRRDEIWHYARPGAATCGHLWRSLAPELNALALRTASYAMCAAAGGTVCRGFCLGGD